MKQYLRSAGYSSHFTEIKLSIFHPHQNDINCLQLTAHRKSQQSQCDNSCYF